MNKKYDWDKLMNGDTHILKQGEHFHVKVSSMRAMCHMRAASNGLKVETRSNKSKLEEATILVVHFDKDI